SRIRSLPLAVLILAKSKQFPAIEQDCYWPIIDQLDLHHSAKAAGCHLSDQRSGLLDKVLIKRLGSFRRRGINPRRPQTTPHVTIQSELRNNQHAAMNVCNRSIHAARFIVEDT